jgi:RNA polymerase sigma-70 factor (ECF subfamily)
MLENLGCPTSAERENCSGTFLAARRVTQAMIAALMSSDHAGAPPSDRALLVRCKAQEPMAFRAFVVRHERAVFALLSRMLGHGAHVEDLAQETFLRAYRAFPSFDVDGAAKPSTWLLTIATRLALDHRKTQRNRVVAEPEPRDSRPHEAARSFETPERERERRELGEAIERAAATLSDDMRAVFVLAEFHDLSLAEIGVAVGIPEATVKTRLFRARARMREALAEWRGR